MIDLHDNVGRSVSMTFRHMMAYMAKKMEPLGLGAGQYAYLFRLYAEDGQCQQRLSDDLLVDKAATVRAINKLEQNGYVFREPDPTDKRSFRIYLTEKGWNIRPQLEKIVAEVQSILLNNMTAEECELVQKLLRQMASNIIRAVKSPEP